MNHITEIYEQSHYAPVKISPMMCHKGLVYFLDLIIVYCIDQLLLASVCEESYFCQAVYPTSFDNKLNIYIYFQFPFL